MANRKNNSEILLKKALKNIKKELGVPPKIPKYRIKEFESKLNLLEPNFLYRIKDIWKTALALMTAFFSIGFVIARLTLPGEVTMKTANNQNPIPSDILTNIASESVQDFQNAGIKKISFFYKLSAYEFMIFDTNGDKSFNFNEAQHAKNAIALKKFRDADKNQDGQLSNKEFDLKEHLTGNFQIRDRNQDGQLSFNEIDQYISHLTREQFNFLDKNQDGELMFSEAIEL